MLWVYSICQIVDVYLLFCRSATKTAAFETCIYIKKLHLFVLLNKKFGFIFHREHTIILMILCKQGR